MVHPATRIQGRRVTSWSPGSCRSNRARTTKESRKVRPEAARAIQRAAFLPARGAARMAATPATGKKVTKVRSIGSIMFIIRSPTASSPEQQLAEHSDHAEHQEERIGAHVTGLESPQAARGGPGAAGRPIGRTVDHRQVKPLRKPPGAI